MNFKTLSTCACAALLGLCLAAAPASKENTKPKKDDAPAADTASTMGTVKGKVVLADGSAVDGAKLKLISPKAKPEKPAANERNGNAANDRNNRGQRSNTSRSNEPEPTAEATADADGMFSMSDVPPGQYTLVVTTNGQGGMRLPVKLKAGDTFETTVKLHGKAKPARTSGNANTNSRNKRAAE